MPEKQEIIAIERGSMLEQIREMDKGGWRLVQINCTPGDAFQIDYSFDLKGDLKTLRMTVPFEEAEIPSISSIYWAAFTYENEIHDLFGIKVTGIALDYGGNFYRIASKPPWRETGEETPPKTPPRKDSGEEKKTDADRKSTRLNSSHIPLSRMPSSA